MPEEVTPFVQPAADISQAPSSRPQSAKSIQWGILGGVGATIVVVGLLIFSASGFFIYNQFLKKDTPTPTIEQVTNIPEGDLIQSTPDSTSSLLSTNIPATADNLPTSAYFTSVEKPEDIPIMPEAQDVTISETSLMDGQKSINVIFTPISTVEEIVAYYEAEMPKYGWTKEPTTYSDDKTFMLYFRKDTELTTVGITTSSGKLQVYINRMTLKE